MSCNIYLIGFPGSVTVVLNLTTYELVHCERVVRYVSDTHGSHCTTLPETHRQQQFGRAIRWPKDPLMEAQWGWAFLYMVAHIATLHLHTPSLDCPTDH